MCLSKVQIGQPIKIKDAPSKISFVAYAYLYLDILLSSFVLIEDMHSKDELIAIAIGLYRYDMRNKEILFNNQKHTFVRFLCIPCPPTKLCWIGSWILID